jgi:hypothetical protein
MVCTYGVSQYPAIALGKLKAHHSALSNRVGSALIIYSLNKILYTFIRLGASMYIHININREFRDSYNGVYGDYLSSVMLGSDEPFGEITSSTFRIRHRVEWYIGNASYSGGQWDTDYPE